MKLSKTTHACLLCAALSAGTAMPARAQSSVQIYGLLDIGIDRISNTGGTSLTSVGAGILAPNIFGFRGSEDLGDGLKANFVLETQFAMDTGATVGTGGFTRTATLGLASSQLGSVRAGLLEDFMFSHLGARRYGPMMPYVSLTFLRHGPFASLSPMGSFDFDRVANARRVANAVRYDSPTYGGFSFGALYGFGEQAGDSSKANTYSLGAGYTSGPWTFGVAATQARYAAINDGRDGIANWGVGGRYDIGGGAAVDFLHTRTRNTFTDGKIKVYEVGYQHPVTPVVRAGVQYTYMKGNDVVGGAAAHQVNLTAHYVFSKRTNVYTSFGLQKVSGGDGSARAQLPTAGPSSSDTQNLLRVGLFHVF